MATQFKPVIEDYEADDIRAFYNTMVFRVWHLGGKERTFRIERVQRITKVIMGEQERRALLRLSDSKGRPVPLPLELNPTNRKTIQGLYGNRPKDWVGKLITLYPTMTDSPQGQVDCIRVRPDIPGAGNNARKNNNRNGVNVIRELPPANVTDAEFEPESVRAPGDDTDEVENVIR